MAICPSPAVAETPVGTEGAVVVVVVDGVVPLLLPPPQFMSSVEAMHTTNNDKTFDQKLL